MHQSVAWLSGSQESGSPQAVRKFLFSHFPCFPRDSVNTVIPLVVLSLLISSPPPPFLPFFPPFFFFSPTHRHTHARKQRRRFNTVRGTGRVTGESRAKEGWNYYREAFALQSGGISCIGWWPLTSGGPAKGEKNGAVPWMDGFSWPRRVQHCHFIARGQLGRFNLHSRLRRQ